MIRLIVSDIDKTLLGEDCRYIDDRTLDCIEKLHSKGITFMAASGRPYSDLKHLFEKVEDKMLFMCSDGAMLVEKNKNLIDNFLEKETAYEIISLAEKKGMYITVSGRDTTYLKHYKNDFDKIIENDRYGCVTYVDSFTDTNTFTNIEEGFQKINIFNGAGKISDFDYIADRFCFKAHLVYRSCEWLEFVKKGTDKGNTLSEYMKMNGIKAGEVMAFGDNLNDISMLRLAGESYAVNNALERVKAAAGRTTSDVTQTIIDRIFK